jgi:hypothetical protein
MRGREEGIGGREEDWESIVWWSRVFTIHATTPEESDTDERPPLPLAAGPAQNWAQASLTANKQQRVEKETTASDGCGGKWEGKVTVHWQTCEPDSFAPLKPLAWLGSL